jgi:flagellar biogenesis protein FliO
MRVFAQVVLALAVAAPAAAQMFGDGTTSTSELSLPDWSLASSAETRVDPSPSDNGNAATYAKAPWSSEPGSQLPAASSQTPGSALTAPRYDSAVEQATFATDDLPHAQSDSQPDDRRLAPRTSSRLDATSRTGRPSPPQLAKDFGLRFDSIYSTISALVFVLGLFFVGMWALRRGGRRKTQTLPFTVVSVLGRVTLAPKQIAELLRVGNKLVLVSLTPDGAKPLTEVTDPAEVDRLMGLCQQHDPHSPGRTFEKMFRDLANVRAPEGFLGDEVPVISVTPDASAYLSRGGSARV